MIESQEDADCGRRVCFTCVRLFEAKTCWAQREVGMLYN